MKIWQSIIENNEQVGEISYLIKPDNQISIYHISIQEKHRRKGYATKAVKRVVGSQIFEVQAVIKTGLAFWSKILDNEVKEWHFVCNAKLA